MKTSAAVREHDATLHHGIGEGPSHGPGSPALTADGLRKAFGGLVAVDGVSLEVHSGEISGLVGPNGSGKSTLLDLLTGVRQTDQGTISFMQRDITWHKTPVRARAGLRRLFQQSRVFQNLSVIENLRIVIGHAGSPHDERIRDLLEMVGLTSLQKDLAGDLSYGQQRLLDFARVMVAEPRIVLLDEPTAGVHSRIIRRIADLIVTLARENSVGFLLVEHNLEFVEMVCDRLTAMDAGRVIATGSVVEVVQNDEVIDAYYGR